MVPVPWEKKKISWLQNEKTSTKNKWFHKKDIINMNEEKWLYKDLTKEIIGAAMEVHRELGPGFLEYVYQEALYYELDLRKVTFERHPKLDIYYKALLIPRKYEPDLIVDNKVVVEIKALSRLTKVEEAQLMNYLKATKIRVGLLLNFGTSSLGIKRRIQ